MDKRRFEQKFEQLTGQQERVLLKLLAGETDPAIAQSLKIVESTVRKHVQSICEKFDLQDEIYKHCSKRDQLRELFRQYKPELVKELTLAVQTDADAVKTVFAEQECAIIDEELVYVKSVDNLPRPKWRIDLSLEHNNIAELELIISEIKKRDIRILSCDCHLEEIKVDSSNSLNNQNMTYAGDSILGIPKTNEPCHEQNKNNMPPDVINDLLINTSEVSSPNLDFNTRNLSNNWFGSPNQIYPYNTNFPTFTNLGSNDFTPDPKFTVVGSDTQAVTNTVLFVNNGIDGNLSYNQNGIAGDLGSGLS